MKVCARCTEPLAGDGWTCAACGFAPDVMDGVLCFAPELAKGGASFPEEDFARWSAAEESHFWHRARRRLIVWALGRYFPDARSFLEIGCGTGYVLRGVRESFPELAVRGSEVFAAGLREASRKLDGVELCQMDARHMPFREELDVVGAFDVLEHIEEDEAVLAEMRRALRRGGGIVLTVPQHPFLWSTHDEVGGHVRRYTARELEEKVTKAGFEVAWTTSFMTTLLPPMILQRLAARRAKPAADDDLRVNPIVNRVFERALDAERGLITRGVSLPVGGSRLLVGRAA